MLFSELMDRARVENHLCSVLLELTYRCNLACHFCYNDLKLEGRPLSLEDYKKLLDDLYAMGTMGVTFTGGEPMVYPHFWDLAGYAKSLRFSVVVKTNGLPLNQRNAERLKREVDPWMIETSLHGADAATHDRQTQQPGSFDRLIRNIGIAKKLGLRLKVNSALTCWNENQVEQMFELCDSLDVPLRLDPSVTPRDDGDMTPLQISASKAGIENMVRISLARAARLNPAAAKTASDTLPVRLKASIQNDEKPVKNCGAGSTNLAIDPYGNVYPCVQFRRKVGNLHTQTVADIWRESQTLEEIRSLAYQARATAVEHGIESYCMGTAELRTGSPLKIHQSAVDNHNIYEQAKQNLNRSRKQEEPQ